MDGTMVQRADKVAYLGIKGTGDTFTYHRMKGFTEMSVSKNPKEYNRQYVDEAFEETDVTGTARLFPTALTNMRTMPCMMKSSALPTESWSARTRLFRLSLSI
jgi:hypothetical protein